MRRQALLLTLALVGAGCSSSPSTITSTTPTIYNDVLTGTVQPPVNGVLQSAFNTFVVGQGGGSVSITLTSAVETLPGGSLLTTVTMGLGVGTVTGTGSSAVCTMIANAYVTAAAGSSAQLSGSLDAGTYCVAVSDVTNQLGPVAYAVLVSHP